MIWWWYGPPTVLPWSYYRSDGSYTLVVSQLNGTYP